MDASGLGPEEEADMTTRFWEEAPGYDMVVAADFGHGGVSPSLCESSVEHAAFLAVNTQVNAGNASMHTISKYGQADYVSLTERELRLDCRDQTTDLRPLSFATVQRLQSQGLAVTRGRQGACLCGPDGGFVVFNYGDPEALGVNPEMTQVMFRAFAEMMHHWNEHPIKAS